MTDQNNQKFNNQFPAPDFSKIAEKPKKPYVKKVIFLLLKILVALVIVLVIFGAIMGFVYYKNIKLVALI